MANSYSAPNFNLDTSCAASDLAGIKGSAVATSDYIYLYNGMTFDFDQNLSFAGWFLGDNSAKNSATKRAYITNSATGITITLNTNTTHEGMDGVGTTSTVTLIGTAANPITITCVNAGKASNSHSGGNLHTLKHVNFNDLYLFYHKAQHFLKNCKFTATGSALLYGYYCDANSGATLPACLDGCEFVNMNAAIYDVRTAVPVDWVDFFAKNEIKLTANSPATNQVNAIIFRFGTGATGLTRYIRFETSTTSMKNKYRKGMKGVAGAGLGLK